jgi:polyhydroxyalkanoate synthesis repressor PhaR
MNAAAAKITIKKYANRRLYDTESSTYVTLDRLAQLIREGRDFVVVDAKTGEDITHQVLTQIIVEEEARGGATMLPANFLRQLIGLYGNNMQNMVPQYLEAAMANFAKNRRRQAGRGNNRAAAQRSGRTQGRA